MTERQPTGQDNLENHERPFAGKVALIPGSLRDIGAGIAEAKPFVTDDDLNFEEFGRQPEYVEVNRGLIKKIVSRFSKVFCHVDVAAGTGLGPHLIIEEAIKENKEGRVIGIDPNVTSLNIARRRVPSSSGIFVEFIEGFGQDLKQLLEGRIQPKGVSGVSILDALHEIRSDGDKVRVIGEMADILEPGGLLAFNSAFTTDGISKDPMSWGRLKLQAMAILGGKRDKQVQGLPIHPPGKYKQMIEDAGLIVIHEERKIVNLTKKSLAAISKYPAFIRGVFEDMKGQKDVSDRDKSNALIQALEKLAVPALPRVWYEIIAQKP